MNVQELFNLTGRVAVVTGASTGLGMQMALALAEAGADLTIVARHEERLTSAARQLEKTGRKVLPIVADMSSTPYIQKIVDATREVYGRLDILVNNAGATWGAPAESYPEERWEQIMRVNVTGSFLASQKAFPLMAGNNWGRIINIASIAAFRGMEPGAMDAVGYNASKGAMVSMTRDLAVKWANRGITVNAIAPGWFPTKITRHTLESSRDKFLQHIPAGRFGDDDDLKGAVVFLASEAAKYVTGQILAVDGGYLAY